jgi:hypothetical protein
MCHGPLLNAGIFYPLERAAKASLDLLCWVAMKARQKIGIGLGL